MPSITTAVYRPYDATVMSVPSTLNAINDMWGGRQESDILLDNHVKKPYYSQHADESEFSMVTTAADHVRNESEAHTVCVSLHNPYSLTEPIRNLYVCECDECRSATTMAVSEEVETTFYAPDLAVQQPKFMPPPPPRVDTYDVIAACGCEDPDATVYNMMVRWYSKTSVVAAYFNPDEACPPPNPELYTFAQWVEMVNEWWYRNFEHLQKKVVVAAAPRTRNTTAPSSLW